VSRSSRCIVDQNDSIMVLSTDEATRPIEPRSPAWRSRCPNAQEVYWAIQSVVAMTDHFTPCRWRVGDGGPCRAQNSNGAANNATCRATYATSPLTTVRHRNNPTRSRPTTSSPVITPEARVHLGQERVFIRRASTRDLLQRVV
jgi:hypothetical protein